jgi:hypothetical protein
VNTPSLALPLVKEGGNHSLLHSFTPSLLHPFTPSLLHSFTATPFHAFGNP